MRILLLIATVAALYAQSKNTESTLKLDKDGASPPARISQLAWMAGQWQGKGLSGPAEEVWSHPAGGSMMGMFRQLKGDAVSFFEIMSIAETNGTLVLRLKHFHADLKGWEQKDEVREFRLVKIDDKGAWFDGLSFLRDAEGGMLGVVAIQGKDGKITEGRFAYKRSATLQPVRP